MHRGIDIDKQKIRWQTALNIQQLAISEVSSYWARQMSELYLTATNAIMIQMKNLEISKPIQ